MIIKRKIRYGKVGIVILKSLVAGTAAVAILSLPGLASVVALFLPKNSQQRYRIKKSAKQLEQKGLIKTSWTEGVFKASITSKGRKEARLLLLEEQGCPVKSKWDGKWHTVLFDIPEKHKNARRSISLLLRKIGFISLQKSVFVYPYECRKEIDFIVYYFNIYKYVQYAVVDQLDNDLKLRNHFNIK